jgi:hypothetical protein
LKLGTFASDPSASLVAGDSGKVWYNSGDNQVYFWNGTAAQTLGLPTVATNKALQSDGSGKMSASSVTSTELGYLSGTTSSVQTQLSAKEPTITAGTTNQYWRGDKTWQSFSSDIRASVSASSPLTYSVITGIIGIDTANTSTNGALTSADWNTFSTAATTTSAATNANTASTIVKRDASGNFAAGTITANLTGTSTNATNVATTATDTTNAPFFPTFVSSSSSGNQGVSTATGLTFNPSTNTLTTTTFSGALSGNATTATNAGGFTGSLAGDVTGAQGTTAVASVGGVTAANVAAGANLANAATNANTASTIVKRDASGNFTAGTITAALTGNVTGNVSGSAGSFSGSLSGDVSGTQGATVVDTVGGQTAANVAAGAALANAATNANTASRIVRRDASGNFTAGTITANLTGNVTGNTSGSAASFTGSLSGDVTGTQGATALSTTGVSAGTYKSVTVDTKGRVTAGTNPTTLAGYGITNAATSASPTFTGNVTMPGTGIWNSSGNVGIGTTSPLNDLDIGGGASGYLHVAGGQSPNLTTSGAYLGWNYSNGAGETDFINQRGAGGGGFYFYNATSAGVIGAAIATINSSGTYAASDQRLKKNIQPIENPLQKITSLQGYTYFWKDEDRGTQRQVGVIAQEVEKVFPELVYRDPKSGYLSVGYEHLVAPVVAAIKEFYHKWNDDSAKIHRELVEKDKEIQSLKRDNAAIKAYLCSKQPSGSKQPSADFCN